MLNDTPQVHSCLVAENYALKPLKNMPTKQISPDGALLFVAMLASRLVVSMLAPLRRGALPSVLLVPEVPALGPLRRLCLWLQQGQFKDAFSVELWAICRGDLISCPGRRPHPRRSGATRSLRHRQQIDRAARHQHHVPRRAGCRPAREPGEPVITAGLRRARHARAVHCGRHHH